MILLSVIIALIGLFIMISRHQAVICISFSIMHYMSNLLNNELYLLKRTSFLLGNVFIYIVYAG